MVHIENELGPQGAQALFDPANVTVLRMVADNLLMLAQGQVETMFEIDGEEFEIVTALFSGEFSVSGRTIIERMREHEGKMTKVLVTWLRDRGDQIPLSFRRFSLVLPGLKGQDVSEPAFWDDYVFLAFSRGRWGFHPFCVNVSNHQKDDRLVDPDSGYGHDMVFLVHNPE